MFSLDWAWNSIAKDNLLGGLLSSHPISFELWRQSFSHNDWILWKEQNNRIFKEIKCGWKELFNRIISNVNENMIYFMK